MARCWTLVPLLLGLSSAIYSPSNLQWYFHHWLNAGNDSSLSHQEFGQFLRNTDDRVSQAQVDGLSERIKYVISRFDTDESGSIEWSEYLAKVGDPIEAGIQQVHLSLGLDYSKMVVMWVTRDQSSSVVEYGTSSSQYSSSANGTMTTYDVGLFGWKGWIHTVVLDDLSPSTQYFYKCGSSDYYWSSQYSFMTPPSAPSSDVEYSFAILGDQGTHIPMGYAVTDQIANDHAKKPFNMIVHAGDIAYAGTGSEWEIEEIWDVWEDQVEKIASQVPYMFAVGNHEHYYNYTAYRTRFNMPSTFNLKFWYSVNYGNCHFIFISTEHSYSPGSPQHLWLQQDLQDAVENRAKIPWIIMVGHRPMYCSDKDEWNQHSPGAPFQLEIEPLMSKYGVDIYLGGHMHMYERTYPVVNGTVMATGSNYVNPGATVHVTQGTGGVFTDGEDDFVQPQPSWSASRDSHWGYARLNVKGKTLTYTFMSEWYNVAEDYFQITKTL